MLSLIVLGLMGQAPKETARLAESLGRLRASFRDPYDSPKTSEQDDANFYSMNVGSTRILFPAGTADRRYYISQWDGNAGVLVHHRRQGNKARVEWIVKLVPVAGSPHSSAPGTLELLLRGYGARVESPVPDRVRKALIAVKPYAKYWASTWAEVFYSEFVHSDGSTERGANWSTPLKFPLPNTASPYPITPQERRWLAARKKTKARRP